jgi:hypothetical protein
VRLLLARAEFASGSSHPIRRCDATSRRVAAHRCDAAAPRESASRRVSPRIDDPRSWPTRASLRDAMEKVRDVTEIMRACWPRRVDAGGYAGRTLPTAPERAPRPQLLEARRRPFRAVGFRRYAPFAGDAAGFEVDWSGDGSLPDDATSRLRAPKRGTDVPDELRDILDDPRILVIGKSRVESPIHRHGRLDRVAITGYDDRGQPCGLAILFGLFTSRALRTPGSQVPLPVASRDPAREAAEPRSHRYRAILGARLAPLGSAARHRRRRRRGADPRDRRV